MTEAQLESAARHYCKLKGQNPDERVPDFDAGNDTGLMCFASRWMVVADKLREFYLMSEAIAVGHECVL